MLATLTVFNPTITYLPGTKNECYALKQPPVDMIDGVPTRSSIEAWVISVPHALRESLIADYHSRVITHLR